MKIKSNLRYNTRLMAQHKRPAKEGAIGLVGSGQPDYMTIPAGATITMDDAEWEKFARAAIGGIKFGNLEYIKAPEMSVEAQADADDELEASLRSQMAALKERQAADAEDSSTED